MAISLCMGFETWKKLRALRLPLLHSSDFEKFRASLSKRGGSQQDMKHDLLFFALANKYILLILTRKAPEGDKLFCVSLQKLA